MTLLESFENGLINTEKPEKIIETVFSKLFFFKDRVTKIYKYKDSYYGQFSDPKFRKEFYAEDFSWNNIMAPEIYLALKPFCLKDNTWIPSDPEKADDYYIEMKRIDDKSNLTHLLVENKLTDQNLRDVGKVTIEKLKILTEQNKNKLQDVFQSGGRKLIHDNLLAIEKVSEAFAPKTVEKHFITNTIQVLIRYFESLKYFKTFDDSRLEASIDNHSDNVLVINNKVEFIDILLPRKDMRVSDLLLNLAKTAGCVAALGSPQKADLIYESYIKNGGYYDMSVRNFYEIFICFLLTLYNDGLGRIELSQKYAKYVKDNLSSIS